MKSSRKSNRISRSLRFSVIVCFAMLLLVPATSAFEVVPVWPTLEYSQGDTLQFIIKGQLNQTNISAKLKYYYVPDALIILNTTDNTTTIREQMNASYRAIKFFPNIELNESGIGLFEVELVAENGFRDPGHYEIVFYNGTGPNVSYVSYVLNLKYSASYMSDKLDAMLFQNALNERDDRLVAEIDRKFWMWYAIILTFVFFWALFVVYWNNRYDKGVVHSFLGYLWNLYKKVTTNEGDLYYLISSENMTELRRRATRSFSKQGRDYLLKLNKHRHKVAHYQRLLRNATDSLRVAETRLTDRDPKDPHVLLLRQNEDKTIEFRPATVKKLRRKRRVAKSSHGG